MVCFICGHECTSNCTIPINLDETDSIISKKENSNQENLQTIINQKLLDPDSPLMITELDDLCEICEKLCKEIDNEQENIGERIRYFLRREFNRTYDLEGGEIAADYEALKTFFYNCQRCSYSTGDFNDISRHFFIHKVKEIEIETKLIADKEKELTLPPHNDDQDFYSADLKETMLFEDLNGTKNLNNIKSYEQQKICLKVESEMFDDPAVADDDDNGEYIEFTKCNFCEFEAPNEDSMRRHILKNHNMDQDNVKETVMSRANTSEVSKKRRPRQDKCERWKKKTRKIMKEGKVIEIRTYCEICGFAYSGDTCTHPLAAQFNLLPIKCKKCDDVVYMKHLLTDHARNKHKICSYCHKELNSRSELYWHEKDHKKKYDKMELDCTWCLKKFATVSGIKMHIVTHTGLHKHTCKLCDKKFASTPHYQEHMNQHENKPKFICKTCGKGFFHSTTFRLHEMLHIDELPCKCDHCPQAFRNLSRLAMHRRKVHLNQPYVYKCQHCGEEFSGRGTKKQHEITQHELKYPYWCKICKKGYVRRGLYGRHLSNVHKDDTIKKSKRVCEYKVIVPPAEFENKVKNSDDEIIEEVAEEEHVEVSKTFEHFFETY